MADTWITPEKKKSLLSYIEQLKQFGGPVEDEDLYAAGFSERDLEDIGWFNKQEPVKATIRDKDTLNAYDPTFRDNLRDRTKNILEGAGVDKQLAYDLAVNVAGNENPTDGSFGVGLADFTPLGIAFGTQEGKRQVERGYNSGSKSDMAMGGVNLALSVASAIPGTKAVGKAVERGAELLVDAHNPNVTHILLGPWSAKADLKALDKARALEAKGVDKDIIWQETGWGKTSNGWRFEINDDGLKVSDDATSIFVMGKNEDVYAHPEFWPALKSNVQDPVLAKAHAKALEKIRNAEGEIGPVSRNPRNSGSFDSVTGEIKTYGKSPLSQKNTAVHELQHATQEVFNDRGKGINSNYIAHQFNMAIDSLPKAVAPAVKNAMRLGYFTSKFEALQKELPNLKEQIEIEKRTKNDTGWESVGGDGRAAERLQTAQDHLYFLELIIEDEKDRLASWEDQFPYLASELSQWYQISYDTSDEWFNNLGSEFDNLVDTPDVIDNYTHKVSDWFAHTLYNLESGEVEARVAAKRSTFMPLEVRKEVAPSLEGEVYNPSNVYHLKDLMDWLRQTRDTISDKYKKHGYAKGGVVEPTDPISGNPVPPGAKPEEVRDDVDAKLSEGEYVIPADVVRYLGLDKIEKLVQQAKDGLAEMDKNGRIGGEEAAEPDDLPFTDEELMGGEELQMATGGFVPTRSRILEGLPTNQPPPVTSLPSWLQDRGPKTTDSRDMATENQPLTGTAGRVEDWAPEDFTKAVKQRSDVGSQVVESGISKMIPLGGLALNARHKYLDKNVPTAIDKMLERGTDNAGNPLSPEQVAGLQKAKADFIETKGYKAGTMPAVIREAKSLVKPRNKPETSKPKSKEKDKEKDKKETRTNR